MANETDDREDELREELLDESNDGISADDVVVEEDGDGGLVASVKDSAKKRELRNDVLDEE